MHNSEKNRGTTAAGSIQAQYRPLESLYESVRRLFLLPVVCRTGGKINHTKTPYAILRVKRIHLRTISSTMIQTG